MKNEKLDEFLYKNRLKSSDLVEFWGVTKGVVSQILNGTTKLPAKRLMELLNNPYGWDVSMLMEDQPDDSSEPNLVAESKPVLSNAELLLRELLAERDNEIRALQEIIWGLKEENGYLKSQLEHKGETALNAGGSSVANVG